MRTVLAFTFSNEIVWRGIVNGLVYALVALGLVLVFRASGVINFAQGQIGAFGGYVMAIMFVNYEVPYGLSFPLAVACGAALGALTELLVVRRLFHKPRLLLFIATLGVAQLILVVQLQLPDDRHVHAVPDTRVVSVGDPRRRRHTARRPARRAHRRPRARPDARLPAPADTIRPRRPIGRRQPERGVALGHLRPLGLDAGVGDRRRALGRERAAHRAHPEPRRRERAAGARAEPAAPRPHRGDVRPHDVVPARARRRDRRRRPRPDRPRQQHRHARAEQARAVPAPGRARAGAWALRRNRRRGLDAGRQAARRTRARRAIHWRAPPGGAAWGSSSSPGSARRC